MKLIIVVFFIFLATLLFRPQPLPESWVRSICEKYSVGDYVLSINDMAVDLRQGLHVNGIRVYDKKQKNPLEPIVTIQKLTVNPILRRVCLVRPKYARLPDSYYTYISPEERAKLPPKEPADTPLLTFPKIPEFRLVCDYPEILGLRPHHVTAKVIVQRHAVIVDKIHIDWPSLLHKMELDGHFSLDFETQKLSADVRGQSIQAHIRPLLEALDVPVAFPYFDAFTDITQPVDANGVFKADLSNGDFRMSLGLRPILGRYNGVRMTRADGILDLYVYSRDNYLNTDLLVSLPQAFDPDGQKLSGELQVHVTNDVTRLAFDIKSELALKDALGIADFIDPTALDIIQCETKPRVTVKGTSGVSAADAAHNNLTFHAELARGSFMGLQLRDAVTDFTIQGDRLNFTKIDTRGKLGGHYIGDAWLAFPGYEETNMTFGARVSCSQGRLKELVDFCDYETGDHDGVVNGWIDITGRATADEEQLASLNGKGSIKVTEGNLAQMKIFAGLTEILADKVPGVGFLVNQSEASADYTIANGIFHSDNIFIEGEVFSLKAWGTYDIPNDNMNFTVRLQFMKKESWAGKIVHPVTWPFTKLLLEFEATGSLKDPHWKYITVLDRLL